MKGLVKIKFKGRDDLYVYDDYKKRGSSPVCTEEEYKNFEESYAFLDVKSGRILRHGVEIGKIEDIEFERII